MFYEGIHTDLPLMYGIALYVPSLYQNTEHTTRSAENTRTGDEERNTKAHGTFSVEHMQNTPYNTCITPVNITQETLETNGEQRVLAEHESHVEHKMFL